MAIEILSTGNEKEPEGPFYHCSKCVQEAKTLNNITIRDYARLSVGYTKKGDLQVWCVRHNINVVIFRG